MPLGDPSNVGCSCSGGCGAQYLSTTTTPNYQTQWCATCNAWVSPGHYHNYPSITTPQYVPHTCSFCGTYHVGQQCAVVGELLELLKEVLKKI